MTAKMFWSCRLTYTLRAMGSYCGIPVSLSKCNVPTISSFLHINYRFRFASLIGDVELVERHRVRAAVRLRFRLQFLDDLHLLQVNHADGVVVRVGRIELPELRNIFHAFRAGCVRYHCHDMVRPYVD